MADFNKMAARQLWRVLRLAACTAVAFIVCAVLTLTCGCSRVVSEDVEVHNTEQSDVNADVVHTTDVVGQLSVKSDTDERVTDMMTRLVDDSLDVTLKVTEYGDDGQIKKVTEATMHRGKKDRTEGTVQQDCHTSRIVDTEVAVSDSSRVAASARRTGTQDVKRIVERRSWWSMHWRMVLAVVGASVMVALVVWKRRRWVSIVMAWIRRFFS